jgi:hypothetical protein
VNRDVVYQAIFDRLRAKVPGIVTWSRRSLHFSKLPASAQPACLVLAGSQEGQREPGGPPIWRLGVEVWVLVRATGQEATLDTVLNGLVDAFEAALARDPDEQHVGPYMETDRFYTTLGGLVSSVEIAGPIEFRQAEGGDQAEVVIPLDAIVLGDC